MNSENYHIHIDKQDCINWVTRQPSFYIHKNVATASKYTCFNTCHTTNQTVKLNQGWLWNQVPNLERYYVRAMLDTTKSFKTKVACPLSYSKTVLFILRLWMVFWFANLCFRHVHVNDASKIPLIEKVTWNGKLKLYINNNNLSKIV